MPAANHRFRTALVHVVAAASLGAAHAAPSCRAETGANAATVVELYTSEGCSSCPPADRWLTQQRSRPGVVALAWHVDYWDRLGWRDRFASPAWTARQVAEGRVNGARFAYTPQVVVDGRDRPGWHRDPLPRATPSRAAIRLERDGPAVTATVTALAGAPARLTASWALLEDGHRSVVKAGENQGATLHHDAVVRHRAHVMPWPATGTSPHRIAWMPPACDPAAAACRVALVVSDADTGRPLQALALGC